MYQRLPFFAALLFSFISLFIKNRFRFVFVVLCSLLILTSAGIAFYHVGVESGKIQSDGCEVEGDTPSTLEDLTAELMGKPSVQCDKPQFVFLGISMAGWNFLISGSFGLMTLIMAFRSYRNVRLIERSDDYQKKKTT
jgi:disulfide bond formation protein DsbB